MVRVTSIALLVAGGLSGLGRAAPVEVRDVLSTDIFDKLSLFEQYSAAAYCEENNDSPLTKITCSEKNCDAVEAAETSTITEFQDSNQTDTTGYVSTDKTNKLIVVAFRGSRSIDNWVTNLDFGMEKVSFCEGCKTHGGFLKSWNEVQDNIVKSVQSAMAEFPDFKVIITGHSLGGAIATIGAAALRTINIPVDLYTYGSPKSGNEEWADFLSKTDMGLNFRVVHKGDIVPSLPPSIPFLMEYAHVQPEYLISTGINVEVTAADIVVMEQGDGGGVDISPHMWYFNRIAACDRIFDLKVKRMLGEA